MQKATDASLHRPDRQHGGHFRVEKEIEHPIGFGSQPPRRQAEGQFAACMDEGV